MVGHSIHPQEPLMTAGLDSLGGMELRRALAESLGLDLPQTLLYDYQSIAAITAHLNSLIEDSKPAAPAPVHNSNQGSLPSALTAGAHESSTAGAVGQSRGVSSVQSMGQASAYWDDRQADGMAESNNTQQARKTSPQPKMLAQPSSLLKTLR